MAYKNDWNEEWSEKRIKNSLEYDKRNGRHVIIIGIVIVAIGLLMMIFK